MFKCDKCGWCCKSLGESSLFDDLNRGDGICKYFNEDKNICNIYFDRPLKCNVDQFYEEFLKGVMTKQEYYNMNYKVCKELKKQEE